MLYYAVIDTNVIVSALLKEYSNPWLILQLVVDEKIIPIYDERILAEYNEVLTRNKFDFRQEAIEKTLSIIKEFGEEMDPIEVQEMFSHESDKKFYEIVMSSRRYFDSNLVTGNIKDFPQKDFVVTPAQMIEIINSRETRN